MEIGGLEGVQLLVSLLVLAFFIYCAYLCAKKGRWVLFVLGFFCGILWIVGAVLPDTRSTY